LEKIVAPIALYPDALVATILPASVYPLEIVQAARFVADTNNLAKLDEQPWDDNVKAIARVPEALKKLNDDLNWTIQLGEAFLAQDKDVMDAIQRLRLKTQQNGMLKTSEQMIVTVTNTVTETRVEQQVVVVTNTIVQIESASPEVIYVPQYNPVYIYAPPPTYVYNPVYPFYTFAAGVAVGVIIANNCDWYHGGCYHNNVNIDIDRNTTINRGDRPANRPAQQKWKPDQNRLRTAGAPASAQTREARGWGGASAQPAQRPATGAAGTRPAAPQNPSQRPAASTQPARASGASQTVAPAQRPAAPAAAARPTTTWQQPAAPNRPAQSPAPAARPAQTPSYNRPAAQPASAFNGVNSGGSARAASNRGAASRGGGGRGGGGRR
jgi:hypothetical protein